MTEVYVIDDIINVEVQMDQGLVISSVIGLQGPSGMINTYFEATAGEILGGNRVVIQDTDGKVYYASNTDLSHIHKIVGVTMHSAGAGETVAVQSSGLMVEPSWNWDITKQVFVSSNGYMTQVQPSSGFVYVIGIPFTNKSMYITIDNKPIVLEV